METFNIETSFAISLTYNEIYNVWEPFWRIPNSLKDSNVSPSERQWKGEESRHIP
jgi:hypothetical protein